MKYFNIESQIKVEPYNFCDHNVSAYEKTIYILAMASASTCNLRRNDIKELACFLEVDYELLNKALEEEVYLPYSKAVIKFGDDIIECGSFYKNDFFRIMVNVFFMYKNLDDLFDGTDDEEVVENINTFNAILHLFDMTNAIATTYECMQKNAFSFDNAMYDSTGYFEPKNYINMLTMLVSAEDCLEYDKGLLSVLTMLLKYEFHTRVNALNLVTVCQILKHSPCFNEEIHNIATDLYNKLLFILKNGRVISINVNSLFLKKNKPSNERVKKDNTTRLQLLYGYSNYDCYDLRLDFSHQGQETVHFNNETPGGVSCCIFTQHEYQSIMIKYPELEECFISYGQRWALKERINCELSKDAWVSYDEVSKDKSHDPVFTKPYSEEIINDFINIVAQMLPKNYRKPIDTNGTYSKYCFNYDVIMRDITLLYLAYLLRDYEQSNIITERIADKAYCYGLTSEKLKLADLEKVSEIAKIAGERLF